MKRRTKIRIKKGMIAALKILGTTGLVATAIVSPNLVANLAKLLYPESLPSQARQKTKKSLLALQKAELIKFDPDDPASHIKLTPKAKRVIKELVIKQNLEKLSIKKLKKWDKKWRIIIFDIPEKLREGRDTLRSFLKRLGFSKVQKSVFICPYPSRVEIDILRENLKLTSYTHFLEATTIDNQAYWEEYFDL